MDKRTEARIKSAEVYFSERHRIIDTFTARAVYKAAFEAGADWQAALASQQAGEAVAWGVIDQNGQLRKNQFTTDKAVADQWLDKSAGNLLRLAPLVHPSIAEPQQQ